MSSYEASEHSAAHDNVNSGQPFQQSCKCIGHFVAEAGCITHCEFTYKKAMSMPKGRTERPARCVVVVQCCNQVGSKELPQHDIRGQTSHARACLDFAAVTDLLDRLSWSATHSWQVHKRVC